MKIVWRRCLPILAGVTCIAALLLSRAVAPDPFERLRLGVFDDFQRLAPWTPAKPSHVLVVDLDDESLKRIGQWPWPRSVVAELVRTLQDLGASSVALDIVFAEPDRTSPSNLAAEWQKAYGWQSPVASGQPLPDHDLDLAEAFARGRVVSGFGLLPAANGATPPMTTGIATIGGDPSLTVLSFSGAVPNLKALDDAAAGHGSFSITADRDQVIRRIPVLLAFDGTLVPSLALEALRVAEGEETIRIRADRSAGAGSPITGYTIRVGDYQIPVETDGALWLHHGDVHAGRKLSAWRLLDKTQVDALAKDVAGKTVFIGTSAVGLADLRATPLTPLEPGVDLHARALEQMQNHHFLKRPSWASGAEWSFAALAALFGVVAISLLRFRFALPIFAMALAIPIATAWIAFCSWNTLIDPSFYVITIMVGGTAAGSSRYLVAERDAMRLRSAFAHYLSPQLVEVLAQDPSQLKLGGELREMTFVFTDLQGFTAMTEAAGPRAIVTILNAYLDGLCRIAMEHGGTVDKIVGDAVHIMFNAPLDQPDHAERGIQCAIAMDRFAEDFIALQAKNGVTFGTTRIGVNTGSAVVGNFGGKRRFDYTAHGDAVNTAARLETANKALGTRICIARATAEKTRSAAFLPVGTLMLKGKSQGVDVFTPIAEPVGSLPWMKAYIEAFNLMSQSDERGAAAIMMLHENHPDHPLLALHARRIKAGEHSLQIAA